MCNPEAVHMEDKHIKQIDQFFSRRANGSQVKAINSDGLLNVLIDACLHLLFDNQSNM